jgi:hypothetical protein
MQADTETHTTPRKLWPDSVLAVILERVSAGESIAKICEEPGMPSRQSWTRWITEDKILSAKYVKAIQQQVAARYSRKA